MKLNQTHKSILLLSVLATGYGLGQTQILSTRSASAAPIATPLVTAASVSPASQNQQSAASGAAGENLFVNIAERTMPSVVNIFTTKKVRMYRQQAPGDLYDFWRGFFDDPLGAQDSDDSPRPMPAPRRGFETASRPMALGTGFIIEADSSGGGLIVTNNHVIRGADEVKIKFTESDQEREVPAEVVGTDPELDVALLKVKTNHKLTPIALGDSDRLKVGEWIAAIGNPFGHGHSVSHGIVSAKERTLPGGFGQYLQVDAPINPGNSGGPLVNLRGEVVGINNAIDARGPGIGFAIPINSVRASVEQLKRNGKVERGYIGIGLAARESDGAPLVAQVMPGGPAARAGLKANDVVTRIDGEPVRSTTELVTRITSVPVGRTVRAEVQRDGRPLELEVRVARRPDLRQASND